MCFMCLTQPRATARGHWFYFFFIALTWSSRKQNELGHQSHCTLCPVIRAGISIPGHTGQESVLYVGNPRFEVPQMLPESTLWGCSALSDVFFSKSLPTFICTSQSSFPSWMEPEHCGFFILLMCPSNAGQPAWHFDWDFKSLLLPIPLFHFSASNTG